MNAFLLAAVAVTLVASVFDLRTGHIPNRLTLGALALALGAHAVVGAVEGGLWGLAFALLSAIGGALLCGLVPYLVFRAGGMGGGDVKLFAAVGALCHPMRGLEAETYGFIAALVLAPARLAYDGTLLRTCRNTLALALRPFTPKARRKPLAPELTTWFRLAPAVFLGTSAMAVLALLRF